MKEKILIGSNVLLTIAVIILFILHFSNSSSTSGKTSSPDDTISYNLKPGAIVCVNIDSLQQKYDMYAEVKKQLAAKQMAMENELASKGRLHEEKVRDAQNKAQKGLLLRSEMEKLEQDLMMEQQGLLQLREKLNLQYMEEEQVMSRKLMSNLVEYLKEFNKDGRYQYVLSYAYGANLLYVPDSLDITREVVKGLNEAYSEEHKKNSK